MTKYTITNSDLKELYDELIDEANRINDLNEDEIRENTPEDSFDLQKSITKEKAKVRRNTVTASVYSDPSSPASDYAELVEYGVPSGAVRSYYKDGGRRRGGVPFLISTNGAQMFQKGQAVVERELKKLSKS